MDAGYPPFKPSTVSRRFSVARFYRTCVIDGLLEHSPAEHVRRPSVPPESPTRGWHARLADHPHRRRGRAARRRASRFPRPGIRCPAARNRKRLNHDSTAQFRSGTPAAGSPPTAGSGHPTPGQRPIGYRTGSTPPSAHSRISLTWPISGRTRTPCYVCRCDRPPDARPRVYSAICAQRAIRALDACSPCVRTPARRDGCWLRTTASDSAPDAIGEPVRASPGPTEAPQALLPEGSPREAHRRNGTTRHTAAQWL